MSDMSYRDKTQGAATGSIALVGFYALAGARPHLICTVHASNSHQTLGTRLRIEINCQLFIVRLKKRLQAGHQWA